MFSSRDAMPWLKPMSTENATKWSLKGKTFHPWSLGRLRKSLETGEDMTNICDVTPAFVGWLLEIGVFLRELAADTPGSGIAFGPQGAVKKELSSLLRDSF